MSTTPIGGSPFQVPATGVPGAAPAGPQGDGVVGFGETGLIGRDSWQLVGEEEVVQAKAYGGVEMKAYGNVAVEPPPAEVPTAARASTAGMVGLGDTLTQKYTEAPKWEKTITQNSFRSWGDPHEVSGSGQKYDNMKRGDFIALQSFEGDFMVQKRQAAFGGDATYNTTIAVRYLRDLVLYDPGKDELQVNGEKVALKPARTLTLSSGATVNVGQPRVTVTTTKGDVVNIIDQGKYSDIEGGVSKQRRLGSVYGELGMFADDRAKDFTLRNGFVTTSLDLFLEEWRVRPGEALIP
ncbi:MAG: hypothetical protein FJZ01_12260 [Candidatus Sericytochromatia bacterium]|nr:hypothetical protein [Candidatus Tanganyikabacteria bacterium]